MVGLWGYLCEHGRLDEGKNQGADTTIERWMSIDRKATDGPMRSTTDSIRALLGTSFGLGYAPFASGTVGTFPALAFYLIVAKTQTWHMQTVLLAIGLIVSCVLTVALGRWFEDEWGDEDPGCFVLDEWAGFLLTVLLFRTESVFLTAVWAFVVTRVFDILKPPPARHMERFSGGWGILLDDLVASLYAAAFLHLIAFLVPTLFSW